MTARRNQHGGATSGGRSDSAAEDASTPPAAPPPGALRDDVAEHLEELAEDTVSLLRRMQALEESLAGIEKRVDEVLLGMDDLRVSHARALDALRRDSIGDRRHMAAVGVLDAMMAWMDALAAQGRRTGDEGSPEAAQHTAVTLDLLAAMLRSMGFVPLEVAVGDPFDPARMQCVGYADGRPGVVLAIAGPGYSSDGATVRPARVLIANPERPAVAVSSLKTPVVAEADTPDIVAGIDPVVVGGVAADRSEPRSAPTSSGSDRAPDQSSEEVAP